MHQDVLRVKRACREAARLPLGTRHTLAHRDPILLSCMTLQASSGSPFTRIVSQITHVYREPACLEFRTMKPSYIHLCDDFVIYFSLVRRP